jgi:hypothetical protein
MSLNFHEDLHRALKAKRSSNRQFGFIFAVLFALLSLRLHHAWKLQSAVAFLAAVALLALAVLKPAWLGPMNRAWSRVGEWIGRITNPILTALLYFLIFTPAGILLRLVGRDPLRLKRDPQATTYWIPRQEESLPRENMSMQY